MLFINDCHYDFTVYYIIYNVLAEDDLIGQTPYNMNIIILKYVLLIFVHIVNKLILKIEK